MGRYIVLCIVLRVGTSHRSDRQYYSKHIKNLKLTTPPASGKCWTTADNNTITGNRFYYRAAVAVAPIVVA